MEREIQEWARYNCSNVGAPPPPVLSESVGKTFVFHGGGQKEIQPLCRVDPFTNHHSVWQV